MAKPVTGKIGQEEVVLNNAATEATLLSLKNAIDKIPGASPGEKAKLKKETEGLTESSKDAGDELDDLAASAEESSGALDSLKGGFGKMTGVVGGLASGMIALGVGAADLATKFMLGGDRMNDLAGNIPVLGTLTEVLDRNIDVYRQASSVGATFGNSLESMRMAAARAELPLDAFQSMVSENSEALATLGGTVSDGARRLGRLSQELRTSEMGERFMGMGFTMEELNEGMADFITLQARQGRISRMTDAQIREGSEEYIEQLDALARLTGKSRKEQADLIAQNQAQANVAAMRSRLEGERLANFDASMAAASGISQEFGTTMADLADGVAQTEFGQKLMTQIPEFGTLAEQMAAGEVSSAEFARRIQALAPELEEFRDSMPTAMVQRLMGQGGFGELLASITDLSKFAANAADPGEIEEEQKRRNAITETLTGFEQTLSSIRSRIVSAFLDSDIFNRVTGEMETFLNWLDMDLAGGKSNLDSFVDNFMNAVEPVSDWFSKFMDDIKEFGIKDTLMNLFSDVADTIKSSLFGGLTGNQEEEKAQLQQQKQNLESMPAQEGVEGMLREEKIQSINERLDELKQKGENGGILGGILGDFSFPDALKVGGAAILGITALSGAFALLGAPQVMAGAAVFTAALIGTGAAIQAAGAGISFAGDGVEKVASGLERMSDLKDVAKLKDIGTSLGSMGDALVDLAVGGGIDAIAQFFGAKSPFDKLIEGVNKFENIDERAYSSLFLTSTHLSSLADVADRLNVRPINEFSDAMATLTGNGILDRLGKFFGGESAVEKFTNDLKTFADIDENTLNIIDVAGTRLQHINSVAETLDLRPIERYTDALSSMTKSGLMDSLSSLIGGNSPLAQLANDLDKLAQIDQQGISTLESATTELDNVNRISSNLNPKPIERYTDAMSSMTKSGLMDSLSGLLGGNSPLAQLANDLDKLAQIDQQGISTLNSATTELDNVNRISSELNPEPLERYTDAISSMTQSGLMDSLSSLIGGTSPLAQLSTDLEKLAGVDSRSLSNVTAATDNLRSLSQVNESLDDSPIKNYTQAVGELTDALKNLNTELANDNNGMFGSDNTSAGELLTASDDNAQSSQSEQLERLNRVMTDILGVLLQSNDMNKRTLTATRSMTGDLYRGV